MDFATRLNWIYARPTGQPWFVSVVNHPVQDHIFLCAAYKEACLVRYYTVSFPRLHCFFSSLKKSLSYSGCTLPDRQTDLSLFLLGSIKLCVGRKQKLRRNKQTNKQPKKQATEQTTIAILLRWIRSPSLSLLKQWWCCSLREEL